MALDYKVDSLEGMEESIASLYRQTDNGYVLDVQGVPASNAEDVTGLKSALEKVREERNNLRDEKKQAEESSRKSKEEAAKKSGDVESLDKQWKEKYNQDTQRLQNSLNNVLVDKVATEISSSLAISGSAEVLYPHVKSRLSVNYDDDGNPMTQVLDKDGKESSLTLGELKKEISEEKAFSPILAGSKASGSGAGGVKSGDAGRKNRSQMSVEDKHEYIQKHGQQAYLQLPK